MFQTMILPLWGLVDQIYYQFNRLQLIDIEDQNVFRVRLSTYRGAPLVLDSGDVIRSGDLLLKIHLYNYQLMKQMCHLESDIRRALYVYEAVEHSLPGLARYLSEHPRSNEIKAVLGVTVLNRGIKRLGFQSFELDNSLYRAWKKAYMIPMYCLCHGQWSLPSLQKLEPKFVVMGRTQLLQRFLNNLETNSTK
ncbi:hypothetical protein [Ammoniphilus sp. YIM 78166]|uniref:YkoP family protein n=1 Tax=Ammoniphilus sp. YIM 78166 TaxID=1644106 RepID=UPI001070226D|nr:hypothetical protein [Ammoniphilus sp. YIM 78166]